MATPSKPHYVMDLPPAAQARDRAAARRMGIPQPKPANFRRISGALAAALASRDFPLMPTARIKASRKPLPKGAALKGRQY